MTSKTTAKVEVMLSVEDAKALRRLLAYNDVVISPSVARRIDNAIATAIESASEKAKR